MPHSVLILDDDADFNSLLTDIFEQADYDVTSLKDPLKAIDAFRENHYDIVVTDYKMPEMTGIEFMNVIKEERPEVPVIMVSGYLENDTIRKLISEGVSGVFLKPLNIFSLLERTTELIEEKEKNENATGEGSEDTEEDEAGAQLGFDFRSYPGKSEASSAFAERLYNLRDFKSTLSLIGGPGMHYRIICEDIHHFYESDAEHFVYLSADSFDQEQVLSLVEKAKENGAERITCVLLKVESMDGRQRALATSLAKHEAAFEDLGVTVRTIFCASGDLDSLFDEGLIDENLYILMGTAEVRVPPLCECSGDISIMAQQLVAEVAHEKSLDSTPRFERSARDLLRNHPWERNYEELRATVCKILKEDPGEVITHGAVKAAFRVTESESPRVRFESYLASQRVDYLQAVSIFFDGDSSKTADFFGTDVTSVEAIMR